VQGLGVQTEGFQPAPAVAGQVPAAGGRDEDPVAFERIGQRHAELAGQVVVAGAGALQRLAAGRIAEAVRLSVRRDRQQRLNRLGDLRAGDLVEPLAAPGLHRDQAGLQQPGQVGAGQRGGCPGAGGQLAGREFRTAEEGEHEASPVRVTERPADRREVCVCKHELILMGNYLNAH
jgi:hypothetical protein